MPFELPQLPFAPDALAPWASAETFSYHHGKHHAAYVNKLNAAVKGTEFETQGLEEIILATRGKNPAIFNNAAQHWNHSFFWNCLAPSAGSPEGRLAQLLMDSFGSIEAFKKEFGDKALSLFGSGWAWLVLTAEGKLEVVQCKDAENPLGSGKKPLLTLDVWEHAYYIDFRNDRAKFIEGFWDHVNWKHAASQLGE